MYSVEPKAISLSSKIFTFEVFPFSRQGVILAIIVSPFLNFTPPLYGANSYWHTSLQNGCKFSIAIFFAIVPFANVSLGLNSIKSDNL